MAAGSFPSPTFGTVTAKTAVVFPDGTQMTSATATGATGPAGATGATGPSPATTAQTANTIYAGPVSGSAAAPGFRAIVPADLPYASTVVSTTASASDISQGAYGDVASVTFTATSPKFDARATLDFSNVYGSAVDINSRVYLYDLTTSAVLAYGTPHSITLTGPTYGFNGNTAPIFGSISLVVGHSYSLRVQAQKSSSAGQVKITEISLVGTCLP